MSTRRRIRHSASWVCLLLIILGGINGITPSAYGQAMDTDCPPASGNSAPVPANVRVITATSGDPNPLPDGQWRVIWDRVVEASSYHVYLERVDTGGRGTNDEPRFSKFTSQAWADLPVISLEPDGRWARAAFVRGSGTRIAVRANASSASGLANSACSEWIYFGTHPAPMVTAKRVAGHDGLVEVRWTPTATASRGNSDVQWATIAFTGNPDFPDDFEFPNPTPDFGPDESNPGAARLELRDHHRDWTVQVLAQNDAGLGLIGQDTVHFDDGHVELSLDIDKVIEGDDVPTLTVTATAVSAIARLFNTTATVGNPAPITLIVNVDSSSTAGATDYAIPANQLPVTFTIPANAPHNYTKTVTLNGLTTTDHAATSAVPKRIIFSGAPTDNSDFRVEKATFTIYPRVQPPQRITGVALSSTQWQISWTGLDDHRPLLDELSYEITMKRVDAGSIRTWLYAGE